MSEKQLNIVDIMILQQQLPKIRKKYLQKFDHPSFWSTNSKLASFQRRDGEAAGHRPQASRARTSAGVQCRAAGRFGRRPRSPPRAETIPNQGSRALVLPRTCWGYRSRFLQVNIHFAVC